MEFNDATAYAMWAFIFAVSAVWIAMLLAFTYRSHRRRRPQDLVMDDAGRRLPQLSSHAA